MARPAAPDVVEVWTTAYLLVTAYPDDALRVANALIEENISTSDYARAALWAQVCAAVFELRAASAAN